MLIFSPLPHFYLPHYSILITRLVQAKCLRLNLEIPIKRQDLINLSTYFDLSLFCIVEDLTIPEPSSWTEKFV